MVRIFSLTYLVRFVFSTIVNNNFVIIIDYHCHCSTGLYRVPELLCYMCGYYIDDSYNNNNNKSFIADAVHGPY